MLQIVAAIILAGGAFYGVYAGAVYATGRLADQVREERHLQNERLDAEAKRLQMQLDAESERLDRQLDHDRWNREVEELRKLVDDTALTGVGAGNAIHAARSRARLLIDRGLMPDEEYGDLVRAAGNAVYAMYGNVERFEVRLGQDHDVPKALSDWQRDLDAAVSAFSVKQFDKAMLKEVGKNLSNSADRYLIFMRAAEKYVRINPNRPN